MNENIALLQCQVDALEKSVRHWEENERAKDVFEVQTGTSQCACCEEFRNMCDVHESHCKDCPIALTTGARYCMNTPYDRVFQMKYRNDDFVKLQLAVKDELRFLRRVLTSYKDKLAKAQHDTELPS